MAYYFINDIDGEAVQTLASGTAAELRERLGNHPALELLPLADRDGEASRRITIDGESYEIQVVAKDWPEYRLQFSDGRQDVEGFGRDCDAVAWARARLVANGHDLGDMIVSDWATEGQDDDGADIDSVLFWRSATDATNDDGSRAIAKLVVIR